jgi:hypothetical protein
MNRIRWMQWAYSGAVHRSLGRRSRSQLRKTMSDTISAINWHIRRRRMSTPRTTSGFC